MHNIEDISNEMIGDTDNGDVAHDQSTAEAFYSFDTNDELVRADEKATFKFPTMQRLRRIADAAGGWPIVVGVPGERFLHIRPIQYDDETNEEKKHRLALESEFVSYPTRRFPAPARPNAISRDGNTPRKAPMKAKAI